MAGAQAARCGLLWGGSLVRPGAAVQHHCQMSLGPLEVGSITEDQAVHNLDSTFSPPGERCSAHAH